MKRIFFSILILAATITNAQQMLCCSNPNSGMRAMANDPAFVASHEAPLPFNYADSAGKMISFPTADGKMGSAYEVLADAPTKNYLIITHEWWGLNNYIKQRADELQKTLGNINVIAIDMYDGKVASTADSAGKYMKASSNTRIISIIGGAIAFAGKGAHIFSLGWCFGGGYALQTAIVAGKEAKGCVMYYGMPETDTNKLKTISCPVLGLFATQDKWINPDVVRTFQDNMKKEDRKLEVKSYTADHGFANPSNPKFDKVSAEDANEAAIAFIKARL
ncbi:MAG TPA: dienelactone hydrolase family protein [Bacteroidia bacterium]|jgi:carboxymethylenebutenolidase|nr:dienelactone hydrolase family protein [Bacteroidia bacterium]